MEWKQQEFEKVKQSYDQLKMQMANQSDACEVEDLRLALKKKKVELSDMSASHLEHVRKHIDKMQENKSRYEKAQSKIHDLSMECDEMNQQNTKLAAKVEALEEKLQSKHKETEPGMSQDDHRRFQDLQLKLAHATKYMNKVEEIGKLFDDARWPGNVKRGSVMYMFINQMRHIRTLTNNVN